MEKAAVSAETDHQAKCLKKNAKPIEKVFVMCELFLILGSVRPARMDVTELRGLLTGGVTPTRCELLKQAVRWHVVSCVWQE